MKTLFFLSVLFFSDCLSAQHIFRAVAADNGQPLAYATFVNAAKRTVYSSNDSGIVRMDADPGDTIRITYIGFLPEMFVCSKRPDREIRMRREIKTMKEVIVSTCKQLDWATVKNFGGKEKDFLKDYGWGGGGVISTVGAGAANARTAALIPPARENAELSRLTFWLKKLPGMPDSVITNPMLITFYEVNDSTGFPGELIINEPVIHFTKAAGRQNVDVDTLHIRIPKTGMYVCLQWMIDERWQYKTVYKKPTGDTIITRQGLMIDGVFTEQKPMLFYDILHDKWFEAMKLRKSTPPKGIYQDPGEFTTLRLEALLKYCK